MAWSAANVWCVDNDNHYYHTAFLRLYVDLHDLMFIAATNSVCVLCNIAYQAPYLYIVHFSAIEVLEIMPGDSELL